MKFTYLYLDTETYSEADLKKVGSYRYAEDPSTEIMICTYAFDEGKVQTYDATTGEPIPRQLLRALRNVCAGRGKIVMANGLLFDRLVIKRCWGFDIPVKHIIDTMIVAFRHALPGSLDMQCQVLEIDEAQAKDKAGKALINRFCKPTPKNYKVRRYTRETHPDDWASFLKYARRDIVALREVFHALPKWGNSEFEDRVLELDIKINDRGFFVDTELAKAAIAAVTTHKKELQQSAQDNHGSGLTGASFLPTLRELAPAHQILNAQKSTLNGLLDDEDLPDEAREFVEMRLGAASTASTKYNPLLLGLSEDGRRRGCLQYGGAKRTLRWAGRGFQPQNLSRGFYHDEELARGIAALLKGRAGKRFDVSKLAASTVRSCVVPEKGCKFVVADYSNVEGRGLAWLAGEQTALDAFFAGLDIYCVTAGRMFGLDADHIKHHRKDLRQIGKACLGRNTQVLTNNGFKDIVAVTLEDELWDGEKWVQHQGVVFNGYRKTIQVDGVRMTEDHLILTNSWKEAKQLGLNKNMLRQALEIGLDGWSSLKNYQKSEATGNYSYNAIVEKCQVESCLTTYAEEKQRNAMPVQSRRLANIVSNIFAIAMPWRMTHTEPAYSTAYPPQLDAVSVRTINATNTMGLEVSQYTRGGKPIALSSCDTCKHCQDGIIQSSKWTESIMTAIMNLEILGLLPAKKISLIVEKLVRFKNDMIPLSKKSRNLKLKSENYEPVFDILNAGDLNRFLIKSDSGFLISHNCELGLGYGGGVAAFLTFAKNLGLDLYAMAEVMDGTFPDHIWAAARKGFEFARIQEKNKRAPKGQKPDRPSYDLPKKVWMTCDSIKRMWRESHPKTQQFWWDLEEAAILAIKNPGKSYWAGARVRTDGNRAIKITRTYTTNYVDAKVPGWWLKVELPSGRILSYPGIGLSVEIEVDEDTGKENKRTKIKYQGENQTTRQWQTLYTYGGKLSENVTQALCRDLLANAMLNVDENEYPIVLHVHDEIITEVPNTPEYNVKVLEQLMCALPDWAQGFPLAAEGAEMLRYAK